MAQILNKMALKGNARRRQSEMTDKISDSTVLKRIQMESYGKLTFVTQARVYPSTACALTNQSLNSVFLT
jgi:hypothetical protein